MRLNYDFTAQHAKQLFVGLVVIEIMLVVAYLAGVSLGHPTKFFDLDGESNLPAWFSSMQLLLISQVIFLKAYQQDIAIEPSRWFWLLGSVGFMFLSADDAAQIHETLGRVLAHVVWLPRFKMGHGVWIFIYVFIGMIVLALTAREFSAMWNRYRRATVLMVAGVALAIAGGVILEIVSYQYLRSGSTPQLYVLEVAFEEFFEMLGASITLYGAILLLIGES
jgi:hypothetical protein